MEHTPETNAQKLARLTAEVEHLTRANDALADTAQNALDDLERAIDRKEDKASKTD